MDRPTDNPTRSQPRIIEELHARWPAPWRHALAVAIFGVALVLRFIALPIDGGAAYLTFYPAMVIAFYLVGAAPGLVMAGLSAAAAHIIFTPPYWSVNTDFKGALALATFLISSGLMALLVSRLQASRTRLQSALAELGESEGRHQAMLEDQTEMICRFRADGTVVYVNDAYCRYFGKSRADIVGTTWHPLAWPEDIARIEQQLSALSPANPVVTIENRMFTADGEVRWCQFANRGFFDTDGRRLELQSVGRDITERKSLEARLAASLAEQRDLYDHAPCAYYSLSPDGTFLHMNETGLKWLGRSRSELIGKLKLPDVLTPEGRAAFQLQFPRFKKEGVLKDMPFELISRTGEVRRVSASATAVTDADGNFVMSRSVMYDVTELIRTKDKLRQLTVEQNAMLDNDLVGIAKVRDRQLVWVNKAMQRTFGYSESELVGQLTRLLYPDDTSFAALGEDVYGLQHPNEVFRTQVELLDKDGRKLWIDASGTLLSKESREWMWTLADITPLKTYQDAVEYMALHDALTGLPNRRLLTDRLNQAILVAQRTKRPLVICYLDLDGFKPVNDRWGHAAGDELLKQVSNRLQSCVRANDTVCRLGGDEFVLMLTDLEQPDEHDSVVQRIIAEIGRPFIIGDDSATVTASIGVTLFPQDGGDADTLLRHADHAMYLAKSLGRNRVCRYMPARPGASVQ
jgi:diguanylate cyclase (GGDEF)-like protein/PAS domain S-box-containing protein